MNRAFDFNNHNDFITMSCLGEICPNKSIQIMNDIGDNVTYMPYLDQAISVCKNNNIDLLTLLSKVHEKTNKTMKTISHNVPSFGIKVQSVIDEWPYEITIDDLFRTPTQIQSFDYDDIIQCNAGVKGLDVGMEELEKLVSSKSDNLYEGIRNMQKKCHDCDSRVNNCMNVLENISGDYEPHLMNVLMDLSTKQKQFYLNEYGDDDLLQLTRSNNCKDIPDKINDMFINLVLVPNMLMKELSYNNHILEELRGNIRNKQFILSKLLEQTPKQREVVSNVNPIQHLLNYFSNTYEEEEEKPNEEIVKISNPSKDVLKALVGSSDESSGEDESSAEEVESSGEDDSSDEDDFQGGVNKGDKQYELSFY